MPGCLSSPNRFSDDDDDDNITFHFPNTLLQLCVICLSLLRECSNSTPHPSRQIKTSYSEANLWPHLICFLSFDLPFGAGVQRRHRCLDAAASQQERRGVCAQDGTEGMAPPQLQEGKKASLNHH